MTIRLKCADDHPLKLAITEEFRKDGDKSIVRALCFGDVFEERDKAQSTLNAIFEDNPDLMDDYK